MRADNKQALAAVHVDGRQGCVPVFAVCGLHLDTPLCQDLERTTFSRSRRGVLDRRGEWGLGVQRLGSLSHAALCKAWPSVRFGSKRWRTPSWKTCLTQGDGRVWRHGRGNGRTWHPPAVSKHSHSSRCLGLWLSATRPLCPRSNRRTAKPMCDRLQGEGSENRAARNLLPIGFSVSPLFLHRTHAVSPCHQIALRLPKNIRTEATSREKRGLWCRWPHCSTMPPCCTSRQRVGSRIAPCKAWCRRVRLRLGPTDCGGFGTISGASGGTFDLETSGDYRTPGSECNRHTPFLAGGACLTLCTWRTLCNALLQITTSSSNPCSSNRSRCRAQFKQRFLFSSSQSRVSLFTCGAALGESNVTCAIRLHGRTFRRSSYDAGSNRRGSSPEKMLREWSQSRNFPCGARWICTIVPDKTNVSARSYGDLCWKDKLCRCCSLVHPHRGDKIGRICFYCISFTRGRRLGGVATD